MRVISAFVALGLAGAALGGDQVVSNVQMPFTTTVFASSTNENVTLTGRLHVLTQIGITSDPCSSSDPCRVHFNLDNTTGVGVSSGMSYQANGVAEFFLNSPVSGQSIDLTAQFQLVPPTPVVPPTPIFIRVQLTFDAGGNLTGVNVGGGGG